RWRPPSFFCASTPESLYSTITRKCTTLHLASGIALWLNLGLKMSSALRIVNLTKTFQVGFIPKKVNVLNGISLEVEKGEIFGLLGPNGAGKTTTIKCILSLIHPDSGIIE